MQGFKRYGALALTCMLFQGCTNVAISGAEAVYNRNSLQNSFQDHYMDMQVDHALFWDTKDFKGCNISISTFNREILLTGQVLTPELRAEATERAKKVRGVEEVYNMTEVTNPVSSMVHTSDAWITTKIRAQLVANNDIDPSKIKVVTENGTVYLMGIVLPEQAEIATDIASSTDGVDKVIKIFSYVKISKRL